MFRKDHVIEKYVNQTRYRQIIETGNAFAMIQRVERL